MGVIGQSKRKQQSAPAQPAELKVIKPNLLVRPAHLHQRAKQL
tara:strand:- start:383 stop:511 length:129 start_codon:yes stop_codon:yes gene_type:complete